MMDIEEIKKVREEKVKRDRKAEKAIERLTEINNMPFHKKLQQPEYKERLERLKKMQKEVFDKKKINGFQNYWDGFLKGKWKSINKWKEKHKNNNGNTNQ